MAPYQERVIQEKQELADRLTKLEAFRETDSFQLHLSPAERCRLERQRFAMHEYNQVLGERITAFSETQ